MQSDDGRAIAKRCDLCKATPGAVGKRGEASHADLGGVRLVVLLGLGALIKGEENPY